MKRPRRAHGEVSPGQVVFQVEAGTLTVLFVALLGIGMAEIVASRVPGLSMPWAADAMRALLLWLIMLGAVVGAGQLKHVRFETVERLVPERVRVGMRRVSFLGTAAVCMLLTWLSLNVVALEYDFQQMAFSGIPAWFVLMAIPLGFGLMGARFAAWGLFPPRGPRQASEDNEGSQQ